MNLRIDARRCDHVVQDRPVRGGRELLEEREVRLDVAGGLRDLDEAVAAFAQHFGEREDVFVRHRVGDHRRAVEVGLHRVRPEPLNREAAQTRFHAFAQQPLHLFAFGSVAGRVFAASSPITYVISDAVGMY